MRSPRPWLLASSTLLSATTLAAQHPTLTATRELLLSGAELDFVSIAIMVVDVRGRMHVWQDADDRIRRFEADGTELEPVARAGEGPGEFRMRSFGGMVGDTFWVSDPMLRRTTFLAQDGKVLRTRRWPFGITQGEEYFGAGMGVQPRVVEPTGTQVAVIGRGLRTDLPSWWQPADAGTMIVRVDHDGNLVSRLGSLPEPDRPCIREFMVPGRPQPGTISVPFCQFAYHQYAIESGRMVHLAPDSTDGRHRLVLRATRLDGRPIYATEFTQPRVRIPREVADSARRERMRPLPGPFPETNRARALAYERMRFPDFYPAVTELFVGRDGSAWVGLRRKARERDWLVFTPEGRIRGVLALPASFRMSHADGQRIWGTVLDDDDLPSVVRYRVH